MSRRKTLVLGAWRGLRMALGLVAGGLLGHGAVHAMPRAPLLDDDVAVRRNHGSPVDQLHIAPPAAGSVGQRSEAAVPAASAAAPPKSGASSGGRLSAADPALAAAQVRWSQQAEAWLFQGENEPDRVQRQVLAMPAPADLPPAAWSRLRWRVVGMVAARSGQAEPVERARRELQALAGQVPAPLLAADQALIQATLDDLRGQAEPMAVHARDADRAYGQVCAGTPAPADCDARPWFRAMRMLAVRAEQQGRLVEASEQLIRARELAQRADEPGLQALAMSQQAVVAHAMGDGEQARQLLAQADRLARRGGASPDDLSRVRFQESRLASAQGDLAGARRAMEEALRLAQGLNAPRLQAQILANLSDLWRRAGLNRQALGAVEQALPVLRSHGDLRSQPLLLHNGGLARLRLGQTAQGRADLDAAQALWAQIGARAQMVTAMREASDALAEVGDVRAALELYHREERLRAEIDGENRQAALAQMKERYRSETEQRELARLERENALSTAKLQNEALVERIWALGLLLLVMGLLLAGLLLKRARDANLQLRRSQALLKVQSERDPLTGLANRRHFREVLAAQGAGGFRGSLLLLDVDHFKRVNDEFGHQAGDAVLVEVAHRLGASVRAGDLACRWGGEEFLIFAPGLHEDGVHGLAQRVLQSVGDHPLTLPDGRLLRVTVSLGYACFPLPRHHLMAHWEQAVNLVDMALYTAKSMGRDRAVGIVGLEAVDAEALQDIERDFELARLAGQVQLQVTARVPV